MRRSSAIVLSLFVAGASAPLACSSGNPVTPAPSPDASGLDGSSPDGTPPGPNDAGPSDGASPDGPPDDGKPFCKSAAAAAAAFCVDFEDSTSIDVGWADVTTSGGATLALETSIARQKQSALAKFVSTGSGSGTASFTAVANAGGPKSKVAFEFDGRFSFPNGPPATNTLFVTIALRTGTGPTGHYFIDIERGPGGWLLLPTGGSGETFPAFGDDLWHRFRISYDGSGAEGVTRLFIDNAAVATVSKTKGTAPGQAPETLDNLYIEHLGFDGDTSVSFYIDNVMVTYP